MNSWPNFATLSHEQRAHLLDGPSIALAFGCDRHTGDHIFQLHSAMDMVPPRIYEQMNNQFNHTGTHDIFLQVENLPVNALVAASPAFRQMLRADADMEIVAFIRPEPVEVEMYGVLPGFAIVVLEWVQAALRADVWYDFLPQDPAIADADKFYWLFPYVAMRALGMGEFADNMLPFMQRLIDWDGLAEDALTIAVLLMHTPYEDPLLLYFARRYAQLTMLNRLPLSQQEHMDISARFPHFRAIMDGMIVDEELSASMRGTTISSENEIDLLSASLQSATISNRDQFELWFVSISISMSTL
jgi:hypothetical protein